MKKRFSADEVAASFHGREPWFNVFVLKPLTVSLASVIVNRTSITPNTITCMSLILGVVSAHYFFMGEVVAGALTYFFSYVCDAIDGKVARLTKCYSKYGAWFDIFVDRTIFSLVCVGLGASQLPPEFGEYLTFALIFLFMLGFESRYNIQAYEMQELVSSGDLTLASKWHPARKTEAVGGLTPYEVWVEKRGVLKSPFTLVEMLIFLFVVSPVLGIYIYAAFFALFVLLGRLIVQQRYWIEK